MLLMLVGYASKPAAAGLRRAVGSLSRREVAPSGSSLAAVQRPFTEGHGSPGEGRPGADNPETTQQRRVSP
jgi:hypothetical protein